MKTLLGEAPGDAVSEGRKDLGMQLAAGSKLFFKAWVLVPELKRIAGGFAVLILLALIVSQWQTTLFSISVGSLIIAIMSIVAALFLPALKWLNPDKEGRNIVIKFALALAGYVLAKIHLTFFDALFLERGKLDRLLNLNAVNDKN